MGRFSDTVSQTFQGVVEQHLGSYLLAGWGASVQRPQEGAPDPFPLASISHILYPAPPLLVQDSASSTLLLAGTDRHSGHRLPCCASTPPSPQGEDGTDGRCKGKRALGLRMLCLPQPWPLIMVRLAIWMFLAFLYVKKLSNNFIQS